jgi:hypothetical protein
MIGIYIFVLILLLIIFYFVFLNIQNINKNQIGFVDKIQIAKYNNMINDTMMKNNKNMNSKNNYHNSINDNSISDTISMETVDDIGNIYNDYYNNIDYTEKNYNVNGSSSLFSFELRSPENTGKINPYDNNYKPIEINKLRKCQVPTLNTEQCYKSRYYECPIVNGSLLQCTNNYIPKPDEYNADCGNRTFDMTPYPWKISENCYYNKIGFDRNKEFNPIEYNEFI